MVGCQDKPRGENRAEKGRKAMECGPERPVDKQHPALLSSFPVTCLCFVLDTVT